MKRLVIFSHASVVATNRELFFELRRHFDLRIVAPSRWRGSLIKNLTAQCDENLISYPVLFSGNGSLFIYLSWFAEVRRFKPDLIFLDEEPWSLAALQIYLLFPKVKKVFYTKQNLKKTLPWPFSYIQKFVFSQSVKAAVVSQECAEVLRWKGFLKPIFRLPHSVNANNFFPRSLESKQKQRKVHDIDQNWFVVSYFGRLTPEKGISDILLCAKEIIKDKKTPNILFLIVGNGPLQDQVTEAVAESDGRLKYLPALAHAEVQNTLASVDLLLLPSHTTSRWKEQFGRVLIEAGACGIPSVGSNSGEIPHLIASAKCGLSFPEGDANAMINCIRQFYLDRELYSKVSAEANVSILKQYSHPAVAAGLVLELESAMAKLS